MIDLSDKLVFCEVLPQGNIRVEVISVDEIMTPDHWERVA